MALVMARARSEPPCSLSTPLSESWDYLCGTSLPDGRFLTIYWPWERGYIRGPNPESIWTGSSSSLTHGIVTNRETIPEYRAYISKRRIAFPVSIKKIYIPPNPAILTLEISKTITVRRVLGQLFLHSIY